MESVPADATLVRSPRDDCRICFASESYLSTRGSIRMLKKGKLKQDFSPSAKTLIRNSYSQVMHL